MQDNLDKKDALFQTVFNNSPVGLVIMNRDITLRDVNACMFSMFHLTPADVRNERFGNVFHCAAIRESGDICGETDMCDTCGLRDGLESVFENGVDIPETVLNHHFTERDVERQKWFKICVSRVAMENDIFAIVTFSDITTQKEYEALLSYQLSLDMATGVINKHTLLNTLTNFRTGFDGMTMTIIDFDDFKSINDRYGHVVGDRVLSMFCAVASRNTRRQDILGRFGGEEFMLVFPGEYAALMVRVLKRIAEILRTECENEFGFSPTFSAGIAEFTNRQLEENSVSDIISTVDENLYQAKKRGKNMIVIDGVSISF